MGNQQVRRFQQRLFQLPVLPNVENHWQQSWDGQSLLRLPDGSELKAKNFIPKNYRVTYRQGGERCKPIGRQQSQTLKRLMQEARIEPWCEIEFL